MMRLKDILNHVEILSISGNPETEISNLHFDSRNVNQDDVFVALVGTLSDGHDYISQVIEAGASVVIGEKELDLGDVAYVQVKDSKLALAVMAANFYGNPAKDLTLIGITGTNGKTTVASLLFDVFTDLGYPCGLISTVENRIINNVIPATHTTPDPINLNLLYADMVAAGCEYCFMEVSSHALHQHRVRPQDFKVGVFTNISHDHLDYHETMDEYIRVKKMLFDGLSKTSYAITNLDDKRGEVMLQNTKAIKLTYSLRRPSDFKAKILENHFDGLLLDVDGEEVWCKMVGEFNASNILAVFGVTQALGIERQEALRVLSTQKGAEGRFDSMISDEKVIGIVDYAHTPDALKNVLQTIEKTRRGIEKVITVVGCGGDRDRTKRPIMAQVACRYSNTVILTSDNPRSENPETIIEEMMEGVQISDRKKVLQIPNRREAIKTACHMASEGDIILIAGKGHEKYQEIKGERTHFDDKEELLKLFKAC
jgi:UDP-N-acetylmuramoyl-L-alanyl-D-glutamate--2,6-diaminopimelate ligase